MPEGTASGHRQSRTPALRSISSSRRPPDRKAALRGEIANFTGVDSPYEPPENAELVLDTSKIDVATAIAAVKGALAGRGYIEGAFGSREP